MKDKMDIDFRVIPGIGDKPTLSKRGIGKLKVLLGLDKRTEIEKWHQKAHYRNGK